MVGAVAVTGFFLTGGIGTPSEPAFAEFSNCGQGLHPGGDVKLRGVLVGRIGHLERTEEGGCEVKLDLFPDDLQTIPANVGAQVRAKTIFGEKWVELLYPDSPSDESIAAGDVIPTDRTVDPLEVESILNIALPLLDAIDPEHLAGALDALAQGFVGHEDAALRGIEKGNEALAPLIRDQKLVEESLDQLAESGKTFDKLDEDLLAALDNLDDVNRFTTANNSLIAESLQKTPALLGELSLLFQTRLIDFTKIVNQGATVIGVVASKTGDLDKILDVLPKFNSSWIANLNAVCRFRQASTEPGKSKGDVVPGRCWRVHNLISESRGGYTDANRPQPHAREIEQSYAALGIVDPSLIDRLLYAPALLDSSLLETRAR